jgi:hypothetical protein
MQYFTVDTDTAIEEFQATDFPDDKHKIFNEKIRPAFEKLIENLIYVYRFYSLGDIETLKRECLTALYEVIPKFDASKSNDPTKKTSKSFSYFNMVAKNWFIARSRENIKKNKNESELMVDLDHEAFKSDPSYAISPHEEFLEDKERWIEFYKAMEGWRTDIKKQNEVEVLNTIIYILKNAESVPIYSKKAVYIYLRDLTGLNSKQIVTCLKRIKIHYDEWKERYDSGEIGHVKGRRSSK